MKNEYAINEILNNEKYRNVLRKSYEELNKNEYYSKQFEEIDNDLEKCINVNDTNLLNGRFAPNYALFDKLAMEKYIEKPRGIATAFNALFGKTNMPDIPRDVLCLFMLEKYLDEEDRMVSEYNEHNDEEIIPSIKRLYGKIRLLERFFIKIDRLVRLFINSVDMQEIKELDDDLEDLNPIEIKHRFMKALLNGEKSTCLKLFGRLRELDPGENYYFEACTHFINEEYGRAIKYALKVKEDDADYGSAVSLMLESYSALGDCDGFIKCVNAHGDGLINWFQYRYLLMRCILNNPKNYITGKGELNKTIRFDESTDPYYNGKALRLVADIIVEGLLILNHSNMIDHIDNGTEVLSSDTERFLILSHTLQFFPYKINRLLSMEYLLDGTDFSEKCEEAIKEINLLLINHNEENGFANINKAFMCQLRLGDVHGFVRNVVDNYDAIRLYDENGEDGAKELLVKAYINGMALGMVDCKIDKWIKDNSLDKDKEIEEEIKTTKIIKFLSPQGYLAWESAEWQYEKSKEEEYGSKDAGLLSLGYFRIVEVELNRKIIIPVLKTIGYSSLSQEFDACKASITGKRKDKYHSKWFKLLKSYKKMEEENFSRELFLLGEMNYFFGNIGSYKWDDDTLASLILKQLKDVLNENGIEAINNHYFEDITKKETRDKYRNPPAHTKYQSYDIACEARETVIEIFITLKGLLNSET